MRDKESGSKPDGASHPGYALVCHQTVLACAYGSNEDICSDSRVVGEYKGGGVSQRWVTKNKASHHGYALACLQVVPVCTCGSSEDVCSDVREFGGYQGVQRAQKQKKNLRQHSVLDWSPTSILSGPCDACLRGSDETRKVHRGMAADENRGQRQHQYPSK